MDDVAILQFIMQVSRRLEVDTLYTDKICMLKK